MKTTLHEPARPRTSPALRDAALGLMALSCGTLASIVACDRQEPGDFFAEMSEPPPASESLGVLSLSLVGQSATGEEQRLRNAIIMVQGPDRTLFFDTEADPEATSLSADVPAGSYSAFLQEGWFLEGVSDGTRVIATLISANPSQFSVVAGESTRVPLRFRQGGPVVSMEPGSFDIVLEPNDPPGPRPEFCSSDTDCQTGEACCISGFLGRCRSLAAGAACALPDLTIVTGAAASSISIGTETFASDSCAIDEGCVGGPGRRRLLRFDTITPNIGAADVILGEPSPRNGFVFSQCHQHFHFGGYTRYELLDARGAVAAMAEDRAFCVLDSRELSSGPNPTQRFQCGFQGLTRGWAAVYQSGQACQWLDITDVPDGNYSLRLSVNPDRVLSESNYDNNTVELPVVIGDPSDQAGACADDASTAMSGCPWSFEPGFQGATCTPGESVTIGCDCRCQGDPMLVVCEGSADCTDELALAFNDDSCQLCPALRFTCPASGVYSALTRPFDREPFSCELTRF